MAAVSALCHRCSRPLAEGEGRPVRLVFRLMAAFSLAPVHAGMWLWEDLSRDFCGTCRRRLSAVAVLLAALVISLVVVGFRWARKLGIL